MVGCPLEPENTNHIGKVLGLSQPTVFKSIRSLEKDNFVQTKQEYQHGKKTLILTDKGAAAALFTGNEKDKVYAYLRRRSPSSSIILLMEIIKDKNDLDTEWMRLFIEYMLSQELKINESSKKKKEELITTLIAGPRNSL